MRLKRLITTLLTLISVVAVTGAPVSAYAAKTRTGSQPSSGGAGSPSPTVITGNDISWPQCSKLRSLPTNQAFGIVGVTGGRANTTNPCFAQELSWATKSTGKTSQPKVSLYVNTGNPGDITPAVADWPTSNADILEAGFSDVDPNGKCTGANDAACSWQYGYNMAHADITYRGVANPMNYRWYLDVETGNSWSTNLANNAADLEGMVAYFQSVNVTLGLYSTSLQWGQIVGTTYGQSPDVGGNSLNSLMSWLPGANSQASAKSYCTNPPLTSGGHVVLTQYISGQFDYDISCV